MNDRRDTCAFSLSGSTKPQRTFPLFKGEKAELKLLCFGLLEIQDYAHLPSERDILGINQENEDRIFAAYQQTRHIS